MEEYGENPDPKYERYERYQAEEMVNDGILDRNQTKDYSKPSESSSELAKRKIREIMEKLQEK